MTHLTELMRAASEQPPPSGIDVQGLIDGERRRSRRLRWTGGLAIGAAVLAAVVAAPVLFSGDPTVDPAPLLAQPSVTGGEAPEVCPTPRITADDRPGPQQSHGGRRPTESCAAAVRRLTTELTAALAAAAPDVKVTPMESTMFVYNGNRMQYEAPLTLTGPRGAGQFMFRIAAPHESQDRASSQCPDDSEQECSYDVTPAGTTVVTVDTTHAHQAEAYRKDGTAMLMHINGPEGEPVLSRAQLAAIADTPGLTLFP